jgi:hypothetical protein
MAALSGILRQWNPGIAPGLSLWIDGSDSKTLTVDGGGGGGGGGGSNISAIRDKSGLNIELVQGTASNQPVVTSNINRLQTVGFSGNNYISTTTSYFPSLFNGANAISQFTIFNSRSNNIAQGFTSMTDSDFVTNNTFSFGTTPNNFRVFKNVAGAQLSAPSVLSNNLFIQGFLQTNTVIMSIINNGSNNQNINATGTLSNLTQFNIGRRPGTGNVFYGDIGEILIYNSNVYTSNTAFHPQIEGYLAWKWGLRSLLESTHPYKNRYPS